MKFRFILIVCLTVVATKAKSQSESFEILREQFRGTPDVHTVSVGGFFCRTLLWMMDDDEFRGAVRELNHVRIISIPKQNFRDKGLSLNGFRKVLNSDNFESLVRVSEPNEDFELFLQQDGKKNRYFALVNDSEEVVGIELIGDIDVNKISFHKKGVVYNEL